jgi:uncharacterized membrane protein
MPSNHAAITVQRSREEVERLWDADVGGTVTFKDAPGDRGTEIHVELDRSSLVDKITGAQLAKVKDRLRRFKQRVETGEVPRSDGTLEGESAERKLKQRPAQPVGAS